MRDQINEFEQVAILVSLSVHAELERSIKHLITESIDLHDISQSNAKTQSFIDLGPECLPVLYALSLDELQAINVRMLAALVLGARVGHQRIASDKNAAGSGSGSGSGSGEAEADVSLSLAVDAVAEQTHPFSLESLRRAYYWGLKNGLTHSELLSHNLLCLLLEDREGLDFAARVCAARVKQKHLLIDCRIPTLILLAGTEPVKVVEMMEGLLAFEPLYIEMFRQQFEDGAFTWDDADRKERQHFAEGWKTILFDLLGFCRDPLALVYLTSLTQSLLSTYQPNSRTLNVLANILNYSEFSPSLFVHFLKLLDKYSDLLFCNSDDISSEKSEFPNAPADERLRLCWERNVVSVRVFILDSEDPALTDVMIRSLR